MYYKRLGTSQTCDVFSMMEWSYVTWKILEGKKSGFCVATMYCFVNFIDLCSTKLLIPCHYARRKHGQSPSWALQLLWLHCGQPCHGDMDSWELDEKALTLNGLNGSYTLYPRHGDMDLPLPTSQHDINFTPWSLPLVHPELLPPAVPAAHHALAVSPSWS